MDKVLFNVWVCIYLIMMIGMARGADIPTHDAWGNAFPRACVRADLMSQPAYFVIGAKLGHSPGGKKTIGWFQPPSPGTKGLPTILVDEVIVDKKVQDQVILHEQCHNYLWRTTGDWNWHR